jgi:hypothetical protein
MNDLLSLLICFIGGFLFLFLVIHFLKKEEEEIKREMKREMMPSWERPQKIKKQRFVKSETKNLLSNASVYGVLIAFFVCSYFIFTDIGSGTERMKLFATSLALTFIIALILLVVSVIVIFLIRVAYYATIVFLIIAGLVIIYLMLAGHEITAFGWPVAAGGAIGVLFMLFLMLLLLGVIMVLPLFLPAFTIASVVYPVSSDIAFFVGIFVFMLTAIGLPCVLSILGGLYEPEEGYEHGGALSTIADLSTIGSSLYLPFIAGFYTSLFITSSIYMTSSIGLEYISSFVSNLSSFNFNFPFPIVISSILFGLLFSSIISRIRQRL